MWRCAENAGIKKLTQNNMKQAIKKKEFSKPNIKDIKAKLGFNTTNKVSVMSSADKPMEFIVMPEAFEKALKLPGIPKGYFTLCIGWSNTGKSSLKNCLIAACQKQGILPVIYETEGNFDWKFAIDCGVEATPVYGEYIDQDTGEVHQEIVDYEGQFLFFDTKTLAAAYGNRDYSAGKETKTFRKQAVIEDIAYSINDLLDKQDSGEIPYPMCFIWDSVGSISSFKSVQSKTGNNMFDAGALSVAFNNIINSRIPSSRKISEPYTNTFFCVNKIWNDSMNAMGGAASIELKGGKSFYYGARLIIHLGGVAKASTKKLTATAKGETYNYGIVTKVRVTKNQLPTPYNVTYEGTMACVAHGIVPEDGLEAYKRSEMKSILASLEAQSGGEISVNESDVSFGEEEDSLD